MNVFLWQSYGSDMILETNTDGDINVLLGQIEMLCDGLEMDRELAHLREVFSKTPDKIRPEIVKFFNRHSEWEAFEYGRFLTTTRLT